MKLASGSSPLHTQGLETENGISPRRVLLHNDLMTCKNCPRYDL